MMKITVLGATGPTGMIPRLSTRRKTIIEGAKIGRVSQATKVAQAMREVRESGLTNALYMHQLALKLKLTLNLIYGLAAPRNRIPSSRSTCILLTTRCAQHDGYQSTPTGSAIALTPLIFLGIQNEQEIDDLWAYVSQYNANGSVKKE